MKNILLSLVLFGTMTSLVCMERVRTFEGVMKVKDVITEVAEQDGMGMTVKDYEPTFHYLGGTDKGIGIFFDLTSLGIMAPWGTINLCRDSSGLDHNNPSRMQRFFNALQSRMALRFSHLCTGRGKIASQEVACYCENYNHPISFNGASGYSGSNKFIFPTRDSFTCIYEVAQVEDEPLPLLKEPDLCNYGSPTQTQALENEWRLLKAGHQAWQK